MAKEIVSTDQAPQPGGPYSSAVVANGFAFIAGQTPKRPDGSTVEGSFSEECEQVFDGAYGPVHPAPLSTAADPRVDGSEVPGQTV